MKQTSNVIFRIARRIWSIKPEFETVPEQFRMFTRFSLVPPSLGLFYLSEEAFRAAIFEADRQMRLDEAGGAVVFLLCAILLARISYNIYRDPANRPLVPLPPLTQDVQFPWAVRGLSNIAIRMAIGTALFSASIMIAEEACHIARTKTSLTWSGSKNVTEGFALAIAYTVLVAAIGLLSSLLTLTGSRLSPRVTYSAIPLIASSAAFVFIDLPQLTHSGSATINDPGYTALFVCALLSSLVVGRIEEIVNRKWSGMRS